MDGGFGIGEKRTRKRGKMFLFSHPGDVWNFLVSIFWTPQPHDPTTHAAYVSVSSGLGEMGCLE